MPRNLDPNLAKRVAAAVDDDARWKIRILADHWLCPFCADVGVSGEIDASDLERRIVSHLTNDCPRFEGGEPTLTLRDLKRRAVEVAVRLQARRNLGRSASWSLVDADHRWVCPYCAKPTEVPILTEPGPEVAEPVEAHLLACAGYREGRGKERPLAALKKVCQIASRARQLIEPIRRRIAHDPQWRQRDANNRWVCPYCRQSVEHIDIATSLLLYETAPGQVAKHLVKACPEFRARKLARPGAPDAADALSHRAEAAASGGGSLPEPPTTAARTAPEELRLAPAGGPAIAPRAGGGTDEDSREMSASASSEGEPTSDPAWEDLRRELAAVRGRMAPTDWKSSDSGLDAVDRQAAIPDVPGLEVRVLFRPGETPAGTFHRVFVDAGGRLVAAAFEPQGPPAAPEADPRFAETVTAELKRQVDAGLGPGDALRRLEAALAGSAAAARPLGVSLAILDPSTLFGTGLDAGTLLFAAAGNPPALVATPSEAQPLRELAAGATPLFPGNGLVGAAGPELRQDLRPSDLLVLTTSGLSNLRGLDRERFGEARVQHLVLRYGNHEADYLVYKLHEKLDEFTGGAVPAVDVLCLALRYEGPGR